MGKISKKYLIVKFLFFSISILNAQNEFNDYFVFKNGDTIRCIINKVKNQNIYFSLSPNNKLILKRDLSKDLKARKSTLPSSKKKYYTPKNLNFYSCINIYISPETKHKLKINKIEKPKDGFAHIYFYKPNEGIGPIGSFIVREGNTKIVNLKSNSYFLIKVKAETKHTYYVNRNLFSKDEVTITSKNKEIYYIKAFDVVCQGANIGPNGNMIITNSGGNCGRNISINEDKYPELQLMSMYKKAKKVQ